MSVIDLTKKAAVSLAKEGLTGQRAAVYLVLDHSGSMRGYYANGSAQVLAERTLGLAANLDDDGEIPVIFFHDMAAPAVVATGSNYQGFVQREHKKVHWGYTDYRAAMTAVRAHYKSSGSKDPALVVFQTDGSPYTATNGFGEKALVEQELRLMSEHPLFWAFVGFGPKRNMEFLTTLDDLSGRRVDNASFFHAEHPERTRDEDLYGHLAREFAQYLTAARQAGVVR